MTGILLGYSWENRGQGAVIESLQLRKWPVDVESVEVTLWRTLHVTEAGGRGACTSIAITFFDDNA